VFAVGALRVPGKNIYSTCVQCASRPACSAETRGGPGCPIPLRSGHTFCRMFVLHFRCGSAGYVISRFTQFYVELPRSSKNSRSCGIGFAGGCSQCFSSVSGTEVGGNIAHVPVWYTVNARTPTSLFYFCCIFDTIFVPKMFSCLFAHDCTMFLGSMNTAICSRITSHSMLPVPPMVSHIVMWK